MPAHNITLYAKWTANKYAITTIKGDQSDVMLFDYGSNISIKDPVIPGYSFFGWYEDKDFTTKFNTTVMPADNITIYAKIMKVTRSISITFDKRTITPSKIKEEIVNIIGNDNFVIIEEYEEGDDSVIIIEFEDSEDAKETVETLYKMLQNGLKEIIYKKVSNEESCADSVSWAAMATIVVLFIKHIL